MRDESTRVTEVPGSLGFGPKLISKVRVCFLKNSREYLLFVLVNKNRVFQKYSLIKLEVVQYLISKGFFSRGCSGYQL